MTQVILSAGHNAGGIAKHQQDTLWMQQMLEVISTDQLETKTADATRRS